MLINHSDIVAEMPLEQSGILNLEDYMPGPNLKVAGEADKMPSLILQSYTAQLFLRKHLNKIHGTLYKPEQSDGMIILEPYDEAKN